MTRSLGFLQWMQQIIGASPEFRPLVQNEIAYSENFNLCYARSGSILKGKQWFFFKILPPDITLEINQRISWEREMVVKSKSAFFKWLTDFFLFFYITDKYIQAPFLSSLGDFWNVRKKILGNVHEICILIDTSNGQYIRPMKTGFYAWKPLKDLLNYIQRVILTPYQQWIQAESIK